MAVKNGLPDTDFSEMNRNYILNVMEGETVIDGKPATDFSRMNRKYIEAVAEENAVDIEAKTITENGTYTAEEGKAFSPVTVNVPAPASDFTNAEVTVTLSETAVMEIPSLVEENEMGQGAPAFLNYFVQGTGTHTLTVPLYKGMTMAGYNDSEYNCAVTGDIQDYTGSVAITGNGTITLTQK